MLTIDPTKPIRLQYLSEYSAWYNMLARCDNPKNPRYDSYGGRGITVHHDWRNFQRFLEDVGPKPTPKHSLDRWPNNDGNYEPGNVKWSTGREQQRNRGVNRILTVNGESMPIIEWAERMGVSAPVIGQRIDIHKWSVEDAVLTPVDARYRHNVKDPSIKSPKGPMGSRGNIHLKV